MKTISLFAGAGGLDLGLIRAGHEVVWAIDNDSDAVSTYRANIGDHILLADVADIDPSTLPPADMVVGGFPCRGSPKRTCADRPTIRGMPSTATSSQPSGTFARWSSLPRTSRGILWLDAGNAIRTILADFASAGYVVQYRLLDAADYGVPQHRKRVFIVGVRIDAAEAGARFAYPAPTHSARPATHGQRHWVTIGEALDAAVLQPDDPDQIASAYKVVPRDFTGHRLTSPDKPSPTILARGDGGGGVCAIPHPYEPRRMTVRESALVQTFPPDFRFMGRLNSRYRQVGNAVPVLLAEAIGRSLRDLEAEIDRTKVPRVA